MKYVNKEPLLLFLFPYLVVSQELDIAPTRLEAFVANPSVIVTHEQEIGELDSLDSIVRMNAIECHYQVFIRVDFTGVIASLAESSIWLS